MSSWRALLIDRGPSESSSELRLQREIRYRLPGPWLFAGYPPPLVVRRRGMQRVGADTPGRVAAAHVRESGTSLGRRATAAAAGHCPFVCLQRDLTWHRGARIAIVGSMLKLLRGLPTTPLQLLMLLPGPGRMHLATIVDVIVGVVITTFVMLVVSGARSVDAPPRAWH